MRRTPILLLLLLALLLPLEAGAVDLSGTVTGQHRWYAEGLINYHLKYNDAVKQALEDGFSALFFLEGCSDNMDSPVLSDLDYYRVSALCVALSLDDKGEPVLTYWNDDASTLPDRPLDFEAWNLDTVGKVGPATVLDGTYEMYSVYHGSYPAIHLRSSYTDDTIPALYMIPEGFEEHRAFAINVHTRTDNHILDVAMWSSGCLLVGDGNFDDFSYLVDTLYYPHYSRFRPDEFLGTVTIHRYPLQQAMERLYGGADPVDWILGTSSMESPDFYRQRCSVVMAVSKSRTLEAVKETVLMSLPCTAETDVRSVPVTTFVPGDRVEGWDLLENTVDERWYEIRFPNGNCYLKAADVQTYREESGWLENLWKKLFA